MKSFYKSKFILLITIQLILSNILSAGTTGKISGRVYDSKTNEPLIGINVVLVGTTMGASTDVDGNYFVLNIPPGLYQLKATGIGYSAVTIKDVRVSVDQTTKIEIQMGEQAIELENVIVTATKPIVQ